MKVESHGHLCTDSLPDSLSGSSNGSTPAELDIPVEVIYVLILYQILQMDQHQQS